MNILSPPRPELVNKALATSRELTRGRKIDGAPALAHAVKVTVTLGRYVPSASPELVAATLLHDAPYFAPTDLDLYHMLSTDFGEGTSRIVAALKAEHDHLDNLELGELDVMVADMATNDPETLQASTADKIVALRAICRRGEKSGDPKAFFAARRPLAVRVPFFGHYTELARPHLPYAMGAELTDAVRALEISTLAIRQLIGSEQPR